MNILHICASDLQGGAARASYRVHRSLVEHGEKHHVTSRMRVITRLSDDPTVIGGLPQQNPIWRRLRPRLNQQVRRGFRTSNSIIHSIAWPATGLGAELQERQRSGTADLVHLHWLGDSTLSIEEIGRLRQPVVWRLADQWAFCGAEHYTSPPGPSETASSDERFMLGYPPASRPAYESGPDLNRRAPGLSATTDLCLAKKTIIILCALAPGWPQLCPRVLLKWRVGHMQSDSQSSLIFIKQIVLTGYSLCRMQPS